MRVTVATPGKYYAFELARQLQAKDCLERLITGYPRFKVNIRELPPEKIVSLPLCQLIYRGWAGLPLVFQKIYNPLLLVSELFDRQALTRAGNCDIFTGWSGFCLGSLRTARRRGAVTVVERASSHMLFQQKIMREEYELWGISGLLAHPGIVERELREYREADYIVVPSSFVKRTFLEEGVEEAKLILNPFGVDLTFFRPGQKEDDVFRVIFAGGIGLRKGVHYLLQAFAELNLPRSELVLIGAAAPEIKPFFRKYTGKFRWIGSRPQNELRNYFCRGSVFVLPSIEEGMAMVQLQAMACGLPLICTPNTGGDDLVDDGKEGFVVPIRDVETLKSRLLYLYRHREECRRMGRAAEARVRGRFTWDAYGQRTIDHYRRMLSGRT